MSNNGCCDKLIITFISKVNINSASIKDTYSLNMY